MGRSVAIAALAIGAIYLAIAYGIPIRAAEDPVGPRMYPLMVGGGMLIIGVMLWMEARRAAPATAPASDAVFDPAMRRNQRIGVFGVGAATVLYAVTMESVGYLATTFLLMLGVISAFHRGKPWTNLIVAAGTSATLYYGLKKLLGVPLPSGLLPFLG